jgi:hypothetical protein
MPLSEDIRSLSDEILKRLDENREFYVHTRQAWRLVQQLARKGRPVGIVDLATKRLLPADDLASRAQRYVTVPLAESIFRELSSLLEDWIMGLIRLWLTAYPEDLDLNFDPTTGRRKGDKDGEIQIRLSRLLHQRDMSEIFRELIVKTVRDKTYERPEKWFRYIEVRLGLGCPSASQQASLFEMKAARDCIEHNQGVINRDYLDKSGNAGRYKEGNRVQIDEPYLLGCFTLLQNVIVEMAEVAERVASGPKPDQRSRKK